jgi:hypothetical protein
MISINILKRNIYKDLWNLSDFIINKPKAVKEVIIRKSLSIFRPTKTTMNSRNKYAWLLRLALFHSASSA